VEGRFRFWRRKTERRYHAAFTEGGRSVIVAVAQSIAIPGNLGASVRGHITLAARAADHHARIVVFPELSLTGYDRGLTAADALTGAEPALQPLRDLAGAGDIVVVAGAPVLSAAGLHIGALCFLPPGGVTTHLKTHLHPGEEAAFVAGTGGAPLPLGAQRVGLAICADIAHPEHAADAASRGCAIYAASCFITREGYDADAALLQRYAHDHQMLVAMANYGAPLGPWSAAGRSAIWSPAGDLLASAAPTGEGLVVAEYEDRRWSARAVAPGE
jgi:predicted amidohydrolase